MASETLVNFTDHPRKIVFRQSWAKPILHDLKRKLDKKLVYLGLPGIQALDIKAWIEYLKVIFAFQCLDDDKTFDQAEAEFKVLEEYLSSLTTKGSIEDYGLYKGYLEQIIMTGIDDDNNEFNQTDYVTVYNLDFCNPLSSPFPVVYPDTRTKNCYKLDAIDKLLEIQDSLKAKSNSDKFLMFVTVNSKFLERDFDEININEFKKYKKFLNNFPEQTRIIRLIKAYAFYYLNEICWKYNYQIEFLPTMYYEGSGGYRESGTNQYHPTMMLTFTILGTKIEGGTEPYRQNLSEFLKCKFLYANNNSLSCHTDRRVAETDFVPDPLTLLESSHTYTNLW